MNQPVPDETRSAAGPSSPTDKSPVASPGTSELANRPVVPDYELIRRIGGGSYGEVWLARSKATGVLRAAKIVWRHTFENDRPFKREFAGIQRFEQISRAHPSQLALFHIGRNEAAGYFYYVMELAEDVSAECKVRSAERTLTRPADTLSHPLGEGRGEGRASQLSTPDPLTYTPHTLRAELEHGRLPAAKILEIGLALTEALSHLHSNGLVHRDVKPSNVIFVNGRPKLADIGLVTDASDQCSIVGTEGYLPPEGPGTPQADIFALGKVLYEAATGLDRRAFPDLAPDIRTWPDAALVLELNEIILKACAQDSGCRYQSCEEMHADLALLQRGQSVKRQRLWSRRWGVAKKLGLGAIAVPLLIMALPFLKGSKRGHTPSPEVAELYESGRWHYRQLTVEDHEKAFKYLSQAVQLDPDYVAPYGELAALYTWCMLPEISSEQRLQRTREIADKALAIDPNAAEGHTALSWCKFLERDWRGAEDEIVLAITLNPNFAIARDIYSFYLSMQGRTEEAHREALRAAKAETSSKRASAIIGSWAFIAERRFDLAIAQLQRVLDWDDDFAWGYLYLGICFEAQSKYVAAIEAFKQYDRLSGLDPRKLDEIYPALHEAYDTAGEQGYWRKRVELFQTQDTLPEEERLPSALLDLTSIAGCYARLGENQKALDALEKHFDEPNVWHQILFEPLHDSLRGESRFKALVERARLPEGVVTGPMHQ